MHPLSSHDSGIYVFGGGAERPKHKIDKAAQRNNGRPISIHKGQALIVSMDGSSGAMQVIPSGEFTANHHALILYPYVTDFELYWFKQQIEQDLKDLASNKGASATLTMPQTNNAAIRVPSKATRETVNRYRMNLEDIIN